MVRHKIKKMLADDSFACRARVREEPPPRRSDFTYAELQKLVTDARSEVSDLTPDIVNLLVGRDVTFKSGNFELPFKAEHFLMSFSLPNFYFHAATTYDILRHLGAPLGKRDFIGKMRANIYMLLTTDIQLSDKSLISKRPCRLLA